MSVPVEIDTLDVEHIRADFPILDRKVSSGMPLVYLDSTATSQKPNEVIQAMDEFYRRSNANIHRGIHTLAEEATALYEGARQKVAHFINAPSARQVIFTRNTTESINLVAYSWGRANLKSGDVVLLTEMEHHSNLVPWHILAGESGIRLEFIPVTSTGLAGPGIAYRSCWICSRSLVSLDAHVQRPGHDQPGERNHRDWRTRLVQSLWSTGPNRCLISPWTCRTWTLDFLAFSSAQDVRADRASACCTGAKSCWKSMPPFMGGGDMIKRVHLRSFVPNELPYKFEAGTPAIAEAVGLGAAVDYLQSAGMEKIAQHEQADRLIRARPAVRSPRIDRIWTLSRT